MKSINVVLVGESWVSVSTHHKGFDHFSSGTYETGEAYIREAFEKDASIHYTHIPGHLAGEQFPNTMEELSKYDVVILSDIGANSLLLSRKVFLEGKTSPNRLKLINEWVSQGGALCMCGGYLSFAGIQASAKFFRTPIEEVLPVDIYTFDDRIETPEGVHVNVVAPNHQIINNVPKAWPVLLGYQEAPLKESAELILETEYGHPLLATMEYGKGRSLVWMSDIGPHWCPKGFVEWEGFTTMWQNAIHWLVKDI